MYSDATDNKVLRLDVKTVKEAYENKLPGLFIMPEIYFGYQANKTNTERGNLKDFKFVEVVEIVKKAFQDYHVVQPVINQDTTVIVAPDNWNRIIPERFKRFIPQLRYIPFSLILHHKVDNAQLLKKLIPPRNALEIIQKDKLLIQLSKKDMLLSLKGHNNNYKGFQMVPDQNTPEIFKRFDFINQSIGGLGLTSRSGRRKSRRSGQNKLTRRSRSNSSGQRNNKIIKKKKTKTKKPSKSIKIKSYIDVMKAFKNRK
jgi:hypothetical protein